MKLENGPDLAAGILYSYWTITVKLQSFAKISQNYCISLETHYKINKLIKNENAAGYQVRRQS